MHSAPLSTSVFNPGLLVRLGVGWGAYLLTVIYRPILEGELSGLALLGLLIAVVAVIIVCSFGVVAQAERLAERLGDPYGTLILTISIAMIEVILIAAVMLGPGEHSTIARDSVMAVSMIILNLVIGVAVLVSKRRGESPRANGRGVFTYLVLLVLLSTIAFVLPSLIGRDGQYLRGQQPVVVVLTAVIYGVFLFRQMGADSRHFQEVEESSAVGERTKRAPQVSVGSLIHKYRSEVAQATAALVLLMVPVVLLSHDMASLLDRGLDSLGAPVALSGLLIAMIVFLPETITTFRAAAVGEMQRVSNLCHGALLSTMGLTIPAVLTIGFFTGQPVVLAESLANLTLLAASYVLTAVSFGRGRIRRGFGYAHLTLFTLFVASMFL
ncbi:hypothetical protein U6G28_10400 [Actinomycetaceae bacterium MB13-C1-2]|nr:hypothetical protein U6G28_10400 [Actinomycetaceae bacterium MB13-C1-2]